MSLGHLFAHEPTGATPNAIMLSAVMGGTNDLGAASGTSLSLDGRTIRTELSAVSLRFRGPMASVLSGWL